jgi:maltose alpha-D-glucosyltransferase/alpha-amylase
MQWSPDRNGGFSRCDPARLYAPLIMDPVYGYQGLNVEAQQKNPNSLLNWTRRMIEIRKRHSVFGLGGCQELPSSNPSVFAFVREYDPERHGFSAAGPDGSDRILCVNNLSRFPQPVELDLRRFKGITPIECMGGVPFPAIGELSYLLTLPGHGFYWFQLPEPAEPTGSDAAAAGPTMPLRPMRSSQWAPQGQSGGEARPVWETWMRRG